MFTIKEYPIDGIGMFAGCDIQYGELVAERPPRSFLRKSPLFFLVYHISHLKTNLDMIKGIFVS